MGISEFDCNKVIPIIPDIIIGGVNWNAYPHKLFVDTTKFVCGMVSYPEARFAFDLFEEAKTAEAAAVIAKVNHWFNETENTEILEEEILGDPASEFWLSRSIKKSNQASLRLTEVNERLREAFVQTPALEGAYGNIEDFFTQMVAIALNRFSIEEQREPGLSAIMQSSMLQLLTTNVQTIMPKLS